MGLAILRNVLAVLLAIIGGFFAFLG